MDDLTKFCNYTPLKIMGISAGIALVFAVISEATSKSSFLDFSGLSYLILIPNILLSLFSYSICFNIRKSVRENPTHCFLSFYLPAIMIFLWANLRVLGEEWLEDIFFTFIVFLPFLIPLTYYYIRFRYNIKKGYY